MLKVTNSPLWILSHLLKKKVQSIARYIDKRIAIDKNISNYTMPIKIARTSTYLLMILDKAHYMDILLSPSLRRCNLSRIFQ